MSLWWGGGHEPTWRDASIGLDNGLGVVPRLHVLYSEVERRDFVSYQVKLDLAFSYQPWDMRYKVTSVTVGEPDIEAGWTDVTSTDLREVRVAELARFGATRGVFLLPKGASEPVSYEDWRNHFDTSDGVVGGVTARDKERLMRQVALHYQLATITSQPPAKAVEQQLGAPPRTAANWIAKAKDMGLLKPVALLDAPPLLRPPGSFDADSLFRMQRGALPGLLQVAEDHDAEERRDGEH